MKTIQVGFCFLWLMTANASVSIATIETVKLSSPEAQYLAAAVAFETADSFAAEKIEEPLKELLLKSARAEDLDYTKKLIVNWKPQDATLIEAEFDTLVIRDAEGYEAVRIKATSAEGAFVVNGRPWGIPTKGSVVKSLRSHLFGGRRTAALGRDSRGIFAAILSPREAFAAGEATGLAPAYVYVQKFGTRLQKQTPAQYAESASPSRVVAEIGPFLYFFSKQKSGPPEVTCRGLTAKGRAKIANSFVRFESHPDGRLILTLENGAQTKLHVTSFTKKNENSSAEKLAKLERFRKGGGTDRALSDELMVDLGFAQVASRNRVFSQNPKQKVSVAEMKKRLPPSPNQIAKLEFYYKSLDRFEISDFMSVQECANTACTKFEPEAFSTAKHWLAPELKTAPPPPASATKPADSAHAKRSAELTSEQLKAEAEYQNGMAALRPLGACCGQESCRWSLADRGVNLKPTSGRESKQ